MPELRKIRFKKFKTKKQSAKSLFLVIGITFLVSTSFSYLFDQMLGDVPLMLSFLFLIGIIFIGIICDGIGNAVVSASEVPFHSMAAQKVKGAKQSIRLIQNAPIVANIFNDVIGDICGIISGSTAAAIVLAIQEGFGIQSVLLAVCMSGFVAALTVGGKALGKGFAISSSNYIVYYVGLLLYYIELVIPQKSRKSH